jgi:hypothetical protein
VGNGSVQGPGRLRTRDNGTPRRLDTQTSDHSDAQNDPQPAGLQCPSPSEPAAWAISTATPDTPGARNSSSAERPGTQVPEHPGSRASPAEERAPQTLYRPTGAWRALVARDLRRRARRPALAAGERPATQYPDIQAFESLGLGAAGSLSTRAVGRLASQTADRPMATAYFVRAVGERGADGTGVGSPKKRSGLQSALGPSGCAGGVGGGGLAMAVMTERRNVGGRSSWRA